MAGFNSAATFIKIAFFLFLLGTILFIVGLSTNVWKTYYGAVSKNFMHSGTLGEYQIGLWKFIVCYIQGNCNRGTEFSKGTYDYAKLQAAQAFACLGLICFILNVILTAVFIFVASAHNRRILIADAILAVLGVLFSVICCAIYASFMYGAVGWSQGLFIAGFLINLVAFVLLLLDFLGKKV